MTQKKQSSQTGGSLSIRKWLVLPTLLVLISSIVIVGFILISSSVKNSLLILDELLINMQEQVKSVITEKLFLAEQLNQTNHAMLLGDIIQLESQEDRETYFYNIIQTYPDAAMTFIGLADGSFYGARRNLDGEIHLARNDASTGGASFYYSADKHGQALQLEEKYPEFDPRARPWYKQAAETGQPIYSEAYIHFVFHEPTITASKPVYAEDGQLLGVLGVNYLLSWLDDLLDSLLIGENGKIVVVDQTGAILASNLNLAAYEMKGADLTLLNTASSENEFLTEIARARAGHSYKSGKNPDKDTVQVEGVKYFMGSMELRHKNLDWRLYFFVAEKDFLGGINKSIHNTILVLISLIIISIIASSLLARTIAKPIERLSLATENMLSGKLEPIKKQEKIGELCSLIDSFNKMEERLTNMMGNLERQVQLRTRELKFANEELKKLSFRDGLTGICNRRKFNEVYRKSWAHAQRKQYQLAVLMLDIDDFKLYNDTYGHLAGDDCLRLIARELESNLRRTTDLVARYGGEEFIILIEDFQPEKIMSFASRLLESIADLNIQHTHSEFGKVTVSVGLAHLLPTSELDAKQLINLADEALYLAKKAGKNQVVQHSQT